MRYGRLGAGGREGWEGAGEGRDRVEEERRMQVREGGKGEKEEGRGSQTEVCRGMQGCDKFGVEQVSRFRLVALDEGCRALRIRGLGSGSKI